MVYNLVLYHYFMEVFVKHVLTFHRHKPDCLKIMSLIVLQALLSLSKIICFILCLPTLLCEDGDHYVFVPNVISYSLQL